MITPKMYPTLKMFIHEAYTRCLTAMQLCNTAGLQGYAPDNNQNMYNVLGAGYDTNRGTEGTVAKPTVPITQTAAMTPFANHMRNTQGAEGRGGMAPGIGYLPPTGGFTGQATKPPNPPHFNIVKKYANWNVCFSCGFDVEEGYTSQTCPRHWRKMNHQEGFTRENSRQWINAGYDPCTKGMHKLQFATF